ncbi:hypothetical protein ACFPTR_00655 [Aliibacillus thermotolerans]|uniref:SLH domain-containing protein n=1 Tax=Aliibacillus thermotolerans TaxID=1834418 RepID=A0ABW0U1T9_9BACI|nr:hypothetical protein [Aliibacillus thermotolerans]MDA3131032.1 hypothetical protein [Aliibacillus thermotolerans]
MNKWAKISGILFILLFISGFFIPIQLEAPPHVRMIVDHTYHVYVSPPCFNDADLTNYLQETDYKTAKELGYEPESSCTETSLVEESVPLNIALLKMIGVVATKWDASVWE